MCVILRPVERTKNLARREIAFAACLVTLRTRDVVVLYDPAEALVLHALQTGVDKDVRRNEPVFLS
ncbi:MAG: hypothetical protein ACR2PF_12455 [Rhizobiaceae bacterium]